MKKFANGVYEVRITGISYGESSIKKTPFFICRFEGSGRYHEEKVHLTENSLKYIKYLYYNAGVNSNKYDGSGLIGANLGIRIVTGTNIKETGEYSTYPKLDKLFPSAEINLRKCSSSNIDYYADADDDTSMSEVFGVDLSEMASDMGIDISDINDGMIMEYAGY